MKLRLIKKEDLEKLSEIYTEVYKNNADENWTKETSFKLLEYWFNKQPDLAFLAEYDGKIVGGFLTGIKPWWDGNHLFDGEIFVHPDYQNKKIGKSLFKKVLEEASEKYNAKKLEGHTFKEEIFPLNWYKKIGFKEVGEWVMLSGNIKEMLKNLEE